MDQPMTYTEDRETFERDLFKPPHCARMLDHAGKFVGRLSRVDKDTFLELAMDRFWADRASIKETSDILLRWIDALRYAARTRKTWMVWYNMGGWKRVRPSQMGRDE